MKYYIPAIIILLYACGTKPQEQSTSASLEDTVVVVEEEVQPEDTTAPIEEYPEQTWEYCDFEAQTVSLGIGLIEISPDAARYSYDVFADRALQGETVNWNIYEDAAPFCAKYHKPDYGIASLVVLDTLSDAYLVLVNEADSAYVPVKSYYRFRTWDQYLTDSYGVRRKRDTEELKNQPLRSTPDESGEEIELPAGRLELFCVAATQGDWIQVKYDCFYNKEDNPHEGMPCSTYIDQCEDPATGWLRWREGSEIWVDIFTMP